MFARGVLAWERRLGWVLGFGREVLGFLDLHFYLRLKFSKFPYQRGRIDL